MFFPKANPVVQGLNSYYIIIDKLIEHFQGEIGTGVIHFRGSLTQGAVFFESEHFMESFFEKNGELVTGEKALSLILENCGKNNYEIYIYYIEPEYIYLWSEVSKTKLLKREVSKTTHKFADELNLFFSEKETGYISVASKKEKYSVFVSYGEIVGYSSKEEIYAADKFDISSFGKNCRKLLKLDDFELEVYKKEIKSNKSKLKISETEASSNGPSRESIEAIGEFLNIFEKFINDNKNIKLEFQPLLKRKFMEHLDTYDFLDPFAAEFIYSEGKVDFLGKTTEKMFMEGVILCVKELADELGINNSVKNLYGSWLENFGDITGKNSIVFPFK